MDLALLVLSLLLLSAEDYFNPSSWPNWHDSQASEWISSTICNYVKISKKNPKRVRKDNGLFS